MPSSFPDSPWVFDFFGCVVVVVVVAAVAAVVVGGGQG